jgi:hypothetical protein
MTHIIVDNFFDNYEFFSEKIKEIPLYSQDEFNKINGSNDTWPGYRSLEIFDNHSFFGFLFLKEFQEKFKTIDIRKYKIALYTHLRLGNDQVEDWIHRDNAVYSLLVYLGQTNYDSGTQLYHEVSPSNYRVTTDIRYIRNRCFLFNSNNWHRSMLNFGDNIHNGRLTLNAFFYDTK